MRRVPVALLLLVACGARTGLDLGGPSPAPTSDAGPPSPMCVAAPQPTALVSLESPATEGGASYAFTGDASRLYTFVWGQDSSTITNVLSIDPCTGASVVISGGTTYQSPLATDGHGVYFQTSADQGQTFEIVRSDPLGQSSKVVAVVPEPITELTIAGGTGYAITQSWALVALALDGSGPTTLVPSPMPDRVRVWWDGTVVDDTFVYFYGSNGLEKVPKGGGATTTLFADGGDSACGGSEPAPAPLLLADAAYIYLSGAKGLRRTAKDGSGTMAYPGTEISICGSVAMDAQYLYFGTHYSPTTMHGTIWRVAKGGGPVETVATTDDPGGLVVTGTSVFWLDYTRAVMKLDEP